VITLSLNLKKPLCLKSVLSNFFFFVDNHQGYYIKKNYKINNRNKIQDITNKKNLEKQRDKKKKTIRYNRNKETRKQDLEQSVFIKNSNCFLFWV